MINLPILFTVILVGIMLLVGMSFLIYQHYRYRRKSIDWGNIERYDTPLELAVGGSNNSSLRSYKYSQLVGGSNGASSTGGGSGKSSQNHLSPSQCLSLNAIERDGKNRGSRSSTKSCPHFSSSAAITQQDPSCKNDQLLNQPYYYYREIMVHPSITKKARHSLPEVVPHAPGSKSNSKSPCRSQSRRSTKKIREKKRLDFNQIQIPVPKLSGSSCSSSTSIASFNRRKSLQFQRKYFDDESHLQIQGQMQGQQQPVISPMPMLPPQSYYEFEYGGPPPPPQHNQGRRFTHTYCQPPPLAPQPQGPWDDYHARGEFYGINDEIMNHVLEPEDSSGAISPHRWRET